VLLGFSVQGWREWMQAMKAVGTPPRAMNRAPVG